MPKLIVIRIIVMGAVLLSTAPISQTFAQVDQQDQEPHAEETSKPNVILLKAEPMPVASEDWPVWARVVGGSRDTTAGFQQSSRVLNALQGGGIGAFIGGLLGFVYGGLENSDANGGFGGNNPDPDHYCVDKNCALTGFAIGAGVGFVLGATIGALAFNPEEKSREQHRANLIIMPLHDGSLGVGLSVAF